MIGVSILPDIVRSSILTTKVAASVGIMPVSLFVVAPFEQGKTRLALENSPEDALIITDLSGIGLLEALQGNQNATTVVINDLSVVMGHRQTVSKLTIAILNALAEEGSFRIAMPHLSHLDLKGRKINIIACCVPDLVSDRRTWWYRSGFMSRMLTIRFRHSVGLQLQIHSAIANNWEIQTMNGNMKVPALPVKVVIPDFAIRSIQAIASTIFHSYGETGYRKHKQLRALACGHAMLRGWRNAEVNAEDVSFLEQCVPFLTDGAEI
jgi:hypothetical protein